MWTRGLARWYVANGRHELPWRRTADPWRILVSEVMLQQTPVGRVRGRWEEFCARWPSPADLAAASRADVLRAWDGLGYPRRAVALHRTASVVAALGWPGDEAGLRELPGVGRYTARALLVFAFSGDATIPADVNVRRVAARAALGVEPGGASAADVDRAVAYGRPRRMSRRDFAYALFDAGAVHCRARPRCAGCPLAQTCATRLRGAPLTIHSRTPSLRYRGSTRELRGVLLRAILGGVSAADEAALATRARECAAAHRPGAVAGAVAGLRADGLIP